MENKAEIIELETSDAILAPFLKYQGKIEQWHVGFHIGAVPQHLYVYTNDRVELGDHYLFSAFWGIEVMQCWEEDEVERINDKTDSIGRSCWKIVGTSDESLGLPVIDEAFIETYIKKPAITSIVYKVEENILKADERI